MEEKLSEIEAKMAESPEDMQIIEEYTALLEQFNNI
jgi:hypothetical protein